ncbi:MAG: TonB family protein, partial [Undibacterium sp.]|nr:TonB family protein [Undibacterium sp.]
WLWVLAISFSGLTSVAHADFELGLKYYGLSNFEKAFREFNQAAKFGDASAQFNLGVMYFRGEFVAKDAILAYAWLTLAAQEAEYKERGLHLQIYKDFSSDQKKSADLAYQEVFAEFSAAAIEKSLIPVYAESSATANRLHSVKNVTPTYPRSMLRRGAVGWVDIFFTVNKDGTTRDHVVYRSTEAEFSKAVLDAVRKWQYEPMKLAGKTVDVHGIKVRFYFRLNDTHFDEEKVKQALAEQRKKADSGDASEQFSYAYYLDVLPTFTKYKLRADLDENANEWYQLAAQNGDGLSSFFLGQNVLNGRKCVPDPNKGMAWLLRAAAKDVIDAQYLLAQELLSGVRLQKNEDQGMYWLNKAAAANSKYNLAAKLRLAWLLSTHPNKDQRDGTLALGYLKSVDKDYHDKQTYYSTAAAVYAENADFEAAEQWQEKALSDAKALALPLDALQAQLQAYRNKQPLRDAL